MRKQHLIDPLSCIACEICACVCPSGAISEMNARLVIDPDRCDGSESCLAVCPTGAIANWVNIEAGGPYTIEQQAGWSRLPDGCDDLPLPEPRRAAA